MILPLCPVLTLLVVISKFNVGFGNKYFFKHSAVKKQLKHDVWMDKSLPLAHSTHDLGHLSRGNRKLYDLGSEQTPLYPGYGTHFSYVYVGTPPQRQSVIIDTGSHYTAFPCTGCSQCGTAHTDLHWEMNKSSTLKVSQCGNRPCEWSQSYTEGSSWRAIQVKDKLWVGGLKESMVPYAYKYEMDFTFGCQTSVTGLFRTQLADGIMGMSISDETLPAQLKLQNVVDNRIFALCFRIGGGIMTLGGVDQRIHTNNDSLQYVAMETKSNGWFGVTVKDILLQAPENSGLADGESRLSVGVDSGVYSKYKGTIVDSGTTDTYLPSAVAAKFSEHFKKLTGVSYGSGNYRLTAQQLASLPTIVYVLQGVNGDNVEVEMLPTDYCEQVRGDTYAFRIYFEGDSGAVLGANFMNGYNIVFDADGKRIGFAISECEYTNVEESLEMVESSEQLTTVQSSTRSYFAIGLGFMFLLWIIVLMCLKVREMTKPPFGRDDNKYYPAPKSAMTARMEIHTPTRVRPPPRQLFTSAWKKFKRFASRRSDQLVNAVSGQKGSSSGGEYELVSKGDEDEEMMADRDGEGDGGMDEVHEVQNMHTATKTGYIERDTEEFGLAREVQEDSVV